MDRHIYEGMLLTEWEKKMQRDDLLTKLWVGDFIEATKNAQLIKEKDIDLIFQTVDFIKVYKNGMIVMVFLAGTKIELDD